MADETSDVPELPFEKNQAAVALGRKGGRKGGAARAARLTPEERAASARLAARSRWAKPPTEPIREEANAAIEGPVPPSPFAKFPGTLDLGGNRIDCYVLDTGERVVSQRAIIKAIAEVDSGNLAEYLGVSGLKSFISGDFIAGETREFHIPGNPTPSKGLTADSVIEIMKAYVSALKAKSLTTDRQREIAAQCSILLSACAKTGLIALIDEATGYQYVRSEDALRIKVAAYIADELREWEKTFPDELWEMFGRLTKWRGSLHSRPKWWGHLVNELIYEALDPDIADYLKKNKPKPFHGQNYHQWMTEDVGLKALISHIYKVIGMGDGCSDMRELRDKVAQRYGRSLVQFTLSLPRRVDA